MNEWKLVVFVTLSAFIGNAAAIALYFRGASVVCGH